jgi:hypothetical protein
LKKLNLANVRSAIGLTIALALVAGVGWGPSLDFSEESEAAVRGRDGEKAQAARTPTRHLPTVTLVFVPADVTPRELAAIGLSPGVMSAGLGKVPAEQTYLDIGQGNRVFDSLYDDDLPTIGSVGGCAAWQKAVGDRAESAPADIVPGMLTRTLEAAGIGVRAGVRAACAFSASRPRTAASDSSEKSSEDPRPNPAQAFEVGGIDLGAAASLARRLRRDDLVIVIARPTGRSDDPLAIGIAGSGFDGNLTSDSTRTDGYVLSTDVAPTILDHYGIDVPSEMTGQPIRAEGDVDPASIESLAERMEVISSRRGPVIGLSLAGWALAVALAALISAGRVARPAVRLLGLSVVYLPLLLLVGSALEPGAAAETVLVALGSPLLAVLTLLALTGYRAIAIASSMTVLAYAIDVIAGSPLTRLSLLGPNPGLGVRFYGIGNELEALLAVLVVAGTGAALTGFAPGATRRTCVSVFLAVSLPLAFIFAAGRFGADVGAAIVLPVGAAIAAASMGGSRRRAALLILAVPIVAVGLLALLDLISGGNAHLTRSVLDAGGLEELADVAQRRLQLSAHSFARPVVYFVLPLVVLAAVLAILRRDRIAAWLAGTPTMRAGLAGALVATLVGALANDSGALLLEIGAVYLVVFLGYAWAEAPRRVPAG